MHACVRASDDQGTPGITAVLGARFQELLQTYVLLLFPLGCERLRCRGTRELGSSLGSLGMMDSWVLGAGLTGRERPYRDRVTDPRSQCKGAGVRIPPPLPKDQRRTALSTAFDLFSYRCPSAYLLPVAAVLSRSLSVVRGISLGVTGCHCLSLVTCLAPCKICRVAKDLRTRVFTQGSGLRPGTPARRMVNCAVRVSGHWVLGTVTCRTDALYVSWPICVPHRINPCSITGVSDISTEACGLPDTRRHICKLSASSAPDIRQQDSGTRDSPYSPLGLYS